MPELKWMDIKEFQDLGFLQEVNRLFFHPLGLALAIQIDDCEQCEGHGSPITREDSDTIYREGSCPGCGGSGKTHKLHGIWDHRDDPEGIVFDYDDIELVKAVSVAEEAGKHREARTKLLGSPIQVIKGPWNTLGMEKLPESDKPE